MSKVVTTPASVGLMSRFSPTAWGLPAWHPLQLRSIAVALLMVVSASGIRATPGVLIRPAGARLRLESHRYLAGDCHQFAVLRSRLTSTSEYTLAIYLAGVLGLLAAMMAFGISSGSGTRETGPAAASLTSI